MDEFRTLIDIKKQDDCFELYKSIHDEKAYNEFNQRAEGLYQKLIKKNGKNGKNKHDQFYKRTKQHIESLLVYFTKLFFSNSLFLKNKKYICDHWYLVNIFITYHNHFICLIYLCLSEFWNTITNKVEKIEEFKKNFEWIINFLKETGDKIKERRNKLVHYFSPVSSEDNLFLKTKSDLSQKQLFNFFECCLSVRGLLCVYFNYRSITFLPLVRYLKNNSDDCIAELIKIVKKYEEMLK